MSIEERVVAAVCDILEIQPGQVTPDADITTGLGADSLDQVEIMMSLEEEFNLEVPDEVGLKLTTVRKIVEYLNERGVQ